MIARLDWRGTRLAIDLSRGRPIAIPLDPRGPHPVFFAERPATASALQAGDFIGAVAHGGSCNADLLEFAPHCHGTHTECVGHLTAGCEAVQDTIYPGPTLARVVSLRPDPGSEKPEFAAEPLQDALRDGPPVEALVIRSLPNDPARLSRDYTQQPDYPVPGAAAMRWLARQALKHLLVDAPSLDPARDGGRLANHRSWWGLDGRDAPPGVEPGRRSVTEMVFVPDEVSDGLYWLELGLSPIVGDATPSRPVLHPVEVRP